MKIASLRVPSGRTMVAVVDSKQWQYWPLPELVASFDGGMLELLEQWDDVRPRIALTGAGHDLAHATLMAPLRPPRNLFCVGKNYRKHAAELSGSGFDQSTAEDDVVPAWPVVFTKTPETVIGPLDRIPLHETVTAQVDYEAELAVIIGMGGRAIPREQAPKHVWGAGDMPSHAPGAPANPIPASQETQ